MVAFGVCDCLLCLLFSDLCFGVFVCLLFVFDLIVAIVGNSTCSGFFYFLCILLMGV